MNNSNTPVPGPQDFDRMERSLFAAIAESEKKRSLHRRLLAGGATLAIVAGALTTASIVTQADRAATFTANTSASQAAAQRVVAYCYAGPGLSSPFVVEIGGGAAQGMESHGQNVGAVSPGAAEAIRLCADHYAAAAAGPVGSDGQPQGTTDSSALNFRVCQRDDQSYAVFPRISGDISGIDEFCVAMGMVAPAKGK